MKESWQVSSSSVDIHCLRAFIDKARVSPVKPCAILQNLISTATLLISVRSFCIDKSWNELKALLVSEEATLVSLMSTPTETDSGFVASVQAEISCAKRLLLVAEFTADATAAIETGCVQGSAGSLDISAVEIKSLERIMASFEELPPDAQSSTCLQIFYNCEALASLRLAVLSLNWCAVEELATLSLCAEKQERSPFLCDSIFAG